MMTYRLGVKWFHLLLANIIIFVFLCKCVFNYFNEFNKKYRHALV